MVKIPFGRTANIGPIPLAATSPSLDQPPTATPTRPPPPPKKVPRPVDKTRKRDTFEVHKATAAKKLKNIIAEDFSNTVVSIFGSLAAEHFSEGDAKKLKSWDYEVGEFIFRASLGEAFYHGLKTISHKSNLIKEQDRSLKKLKGENHALNAKLNEAKKKAEEDAKAREDEIVKLRATLEEAKKKSEKTIKTLRGETSKAQGELEAARATSAKK